MFARLLALVCLGCFCTVICRSEVVRLPERKLVVFLRGETPAPAGSVSEMKLEVQSLLHQMGVSVEWRSSADGLEVDGKVAVLELRGVCEGASKLGSLTVITGERLASTAVSDGNILPFSWINCDTLNRFLSPVLEGQAEDRREFLYGRAMGRLAAHELYHVLSNTPGHDGFGVAKPSFTTHDVLTDQFDFDQNTLARLKSMPTACGVGPATETTGHCALLPLKSCWANLRITVNQRDESGVITVRNYLRLPCSQNARNPANPVDLLVRPHFVTRGVRAGDRHVLPASPCASGWELQLRA